jgi:uncharacterized protein
MNSMSAIPWHQYSIIAYLAGQLGHKRKLGKTAMQKLVYLIQELENVPVGYSFHFYHYGPYSSGLAGDLEFVSSLQGIQINYDPLLNMYNISNGDKAQVLVKKSEDFMNRYTYEINQILNAFGSKRAEELELIASIVYTWKAVNEENSHQEQHIIGQVAELKPKFTLQEIHAALENLKTRGYLRGPNP